MFIAIIQNKHNLYVPTLYLHKITAQYNERNGNMQLKVQQNNYMNVFNKLSK